MSAGSFGDPVEPPHGARESLRAATSLEAQCAITSLRIDLAQLQDGLHLDARHAELRFWGARADMNALVLVALRRPYTFVVLAILILLFGAISVFKTPTDIFPPIRIPVVASIWTYNGLLPTDMSGRIIYYYERNLTSTVSNIEHIESQSYYGSGVVKVFFQPGTDVAAAQAQITAAAQTCSSNCPRAPRLQRSWSTMLRRSRSSPCRSRRTT